jgi:hypothetical protein
VEDTYNSFDIQSSGEKPAMTNGRSYKSWTQLQEGCWRANTYPWLSQIGTALDRYLTPPTCQLEGILFCLGIFRTYQAQQSSVTALPVLPSEFPLTANLTPIPRGPLPALLALSSIRSPERICCNPCPAPCRRLLPSFTRGRRNLQSLLRLYGAFPVSAGPIRKLLTL